MGFEPLVEGGHDDPREEVSFGEHVLPRGRWEALSVSQAGSREGGRERGRGLVGGADVDFAVHFIPHSREIPLQGLHLQWKPALSGLGLGWVESAVSTLIAFMAVSSSNCSTKKESSASASKFLLIFFHSCL